MWTHKTVLVLLGVWMTSRQTWTNFYRTKEIRSPPQGTTVVCFGVLTGPLLIALSTKTVYLSTHPAISIIAVSCGIYNNEPYDGKWYTKRYVSLQCISYEFPLHISRKVSNNYAWLHSCRELWQCKTIHNFIVSTQLSVVCVLNFPHI